MRLDALFVFKEGFTHDNAEIVHIVYSSESGDSYGNFTNRTTTKSSRHGHGDSLNKNGKPRNRNGVAC